MQQPEQNGHEHDGGQYRPRSGSGLSGSNQTDGDLEGQEVEEILIKQEQQQGNWANTNGLSNINWNGTNNGRPNGGYLINRTNPDHETPITSPNCMTSPNGNIGTDTEEGGMESDNDSMDNCPRKREPTLRHSRSDRDGTRRDGKRPRKRGPKRPPVNNPRLVSNGYYSSSQLSSPTGDFDPTGEYETIRNHQSDSNQQDQIMNQDPIFTFNQPPRLPSSEFRPQDQPRLTIITQPGEHHRARYESEGSRGAVKDESGDGSPKIRLEGYRGNSTIPVHVFVSNEKGQIKPHIFFRTCKIASRNSTPCDDEEFILNGQRTDAIRINLSPKDDFTAIVDCVGILKLRNADVENESKSKSQPKPKRRNPTVRLAFHALIPNTDPSQQDFPLMVASNPISCSQPEGQSEILRMSSLLGNPEGGDEVFIIGKNFNKNCQIIFKSVDCDWQGDATIHTSFFHKEHLVISTPKLHDTEIYADFPVKVYIQSQGKTSEPYEKDFVYKPQVRIEAPDSIQGPMKQLSVNHDGPAQTGRTQVVRADAPMRDKRGSDASRPTPYDRGSVDRRQGREISMFDTEQTYEPRDMKTEPDPNEPNQLVKPVPKTIDAPEGQPWIQAPRIDNNPSQLFHSGPTEFKPTHPPNPNLAISPTLSPSQPQINSPQQINEPVIPQSDPISMEPYEPSTKRMMPDPGAEYLDQNQISYTQQVPQQVSSQNTFNQPQVQPVPNQSEVFKVPVEEPEDEKPLARSFYPAQETGFDLPPKTEAVQDVSNHVTFGSANQPNPSNYVSQQATHPTHTVTSHVFQGQLMDYQREFSASNQMQVSDVSTNLNVGNFSQSQSNHVQSHDMNDQSNGFAQQPPVSSPQTQVLIGSGPVSCSTNQVQSMTIVQQQSQHPQQSISATTIGLQPQQQAAPQQQVMQVDATTVMQVVPTHQTSIMSTRQEEANITYQVTHSGVTHTGVSHSQVTHNQVTQDPNPPTHQQIWSHKDNQSHQVQGIPKPSEPSVQDTQYFEQTNRFEPTNQNSGFHDSSANQNSEFKFQQNSNFQSPPQQQVVQQSVQVQQQANQMVPQQYDHSSPLAAACSPLAQASSPLNCLGSPLEVVPGQAVTGLGQTEQFNTHGQQITQQETQPTSKLPPPSQINVKNDSYANSNADAYVVKDDPYVKPEDTLIGELSPRQSLVNNNAHANTGLTTHTLGSSSHSLVNRVIEENPLPNLDGFRKLEPVEPTNQIKDPIRTYEESTHGYHQTEAQPTQQTTSLPNPVYSSPNTNSSGQVYHQTEWIPAERMVTPPWEANPIGTSMGIPDPDVVMRPSSATDGPPEVVQSLGSPPVVGLNPNSHSGGGQVVAQQQQSLLGGAVHVQNEPSMNHTVQIKTDKVESITTREITEQEIRALIQDPNVSIRTTVEHTEPNAYTTPQNNTQQRSLNQHQPY